MTIFGHTFVLTHEWNGRSGLSIERQLNVNPVGRIQRMETVFDESSNWALRRAVF